VEWDVVSLHYPQFHDPGIQYEPIVIAGIIIILIVVSGGVMKARDWGAKAARQRGVFQVIAADSQRPEVVVLRIYGEYLITAPFDRSTREFEKKLYLLKISDMTKLPLTLEKVGPLKVKP
jgi:hypothetical protein